MILYSLGISCFGFIGLFKEFSDIDAKGASFLRSFWGFISLFLFVIFFNRKLLNTNLSFLLRNIIWGSLLGLAIFVYFQTIDYSNQSIAALFLFLQVVWYPIYSKLFFANETQKTRWFIYISSTLGTIIGVFVALDFFGENSFNELNFNSIISGLSVSFLAFLYFIFGRLLFFAYNETEKKLVYKVLTSLSLEDFYQKLLKDEIKEINKESSNFWLSYKKTLFQSFGMLLVSLLYIDYNYIFISNLLKPNSIIYGILLGTICFSIAFFLITYSDSVTINNSKYIPLNNKFKGLSQQIELLVSLILGYVFLNENLGVHGFIGVLILVISYVIGILYSENNNN
jgi:drug/metabolite transporter (DMT)-like permease